ncbi:cytochrome c biogenesis protein CcdA [candidate division WWE3 bacterium]|jgi:cytochrome c-type biogenesis protein|uniref:Cytochrome c biogenesis protein CcdA n=1 Tax=candidate division WWE3 bacterium TaxID=2053526 RepID=A0A3A4ZAM1_UNCKA|nr:MAG: cytochrome c biogenesis protein CcdA [candidate division WWE3 bacterium]
MIENSSQVTLLVAFAGGILTFFASCLLPLVPTYIAYLAGTSLSELTDKDNAKKYRATIFYDSLAFVIGFLLIFVIFGLTASTLGHVFNSYRVIIQKIGGTALLVFGLLVLGFIKPLELLKERKLNLPFNLTKFKLANAFLFGITFGFAWTPCIGPILAAILFWASQSETILKGTFLLFAFGLGMGLPFILLGLLSEKLLPVIKKIRYLTKISQLLSGVLLILMGLALITGKAEFISMQLINLLNLRMLAL